MLRLRIFTFITLMVMVFGVFAESYDFTSDETHYVQSLESGTIAMQARLDMIARAKKSIELEYFIFHNDEATRILTEALLRKKRDNPEIRIRLLLDYFALSKSLSPLLTTELMSKGLEIKYYNPAFIFRLSKVVKRNHRKIFLVDDTEVIIGGRNIGNEYFDLRDKFNFSDREVWIKGPIVADVRKSFDGFWDYKDSRLPVAYHVDVYREQDSNRLQQYLDELEEAKKLASLFNPNDTEDARHLEYKKRFKEIGGRLLKEEPIYKINSIRFVSDGPNADDPLDRLSGKVYYSLMTDAQISIDIETPYFYLQKEETRIFQSIKDRNVRVNLLINSKKSSHEFAINYITLLEGLKFARMGFDVNLNRGKLMSAEDLVRPEIAPEGVWVVHAKTMLIDDHLTWIGSLNMDPRSVQRLNSELGVLIDDVEFNKRVSKHYMTRLRNSSSIDINGKTKDGTDPSQIESLRERLYQLKSLPFYLFEQQI